MNIAVRRFLGCANWSEDEQGGCNYFVWLNPPLCEHTRMVTPGLTWKLENMDAKYKDLMDELRKIKSRARWA